MILYALYVDAIFFPCHPYIWSTTVLHDSVQVSGLHYCIFGFSHACKMYIGFMSLHPRSHLYYNYTSNHSSDRMDGGPKESYYVLGCSSERRHL